MQNCRICLDARIDALNMSRKRSSCVIVSTGVDFRLEIIYLQNHVSIAVFAFYKTKN